MSPEVKIKTLSVVAGTRACNARCAYCVSKMTPTRGLGFAEQEINWNRFSRALDYARDGQTDTLMLTSKGEPLLFPNEITSYLTRSREFEESTGFNFKEKELQTNGIAIAKDPERFDPLLRQWAELGLGTISVSIVHFDQEMNRRIFLPHKKAYIDLPELIKTIHDHGIKVRLACVLVKGFIEDRESFKQLIQFAKDHEVEQLTVRPVNKPENSISEDVKKWTEDHQLTKAEVDNMEDLLLENGTKMKVLPHDAIVYEIDGQNVCFANSLTKNDETYFRQLIFFPNGIISPEWTGEGENLP